MEARGARPLAGLRTPRWFPRCSALLEFPCCTIVPKLCALRDQSVRFAGVPDLWSERVNGDLAFAGVSADDPAILLAHNPDTKDVLADRPWDLMLSGHTHGGQVVLPILGDRFTPVRDKRFIAGLKAMERASGVCHARSGEH